MVILAKQKGHGIAKTLSKMKPNLQDEFPEGVKAKVILQTDLQKICTPIAETLTNLFVLKTDKRSFLLEFESTKELKEWISQFGETKEKKERTFSSLKT